MLEIGTKNGTSLVQIDLNGSSVSVEKVDAVFVLRWSDGVINEWQEYYPSLSVALARASVLATCAESGWELGFANSPQEFSGLATEFLRSEVS